MKMSDVFGDNVLLAVDGAGYCINQIHYFNPSKNCDCTDEIHSSPESAEMIHHAINNHDRMVEEIAELRKGLEIMIEQFESDHNCEYEYNIIRWNKDLLAKPNQEGGE
ncbi:hypothetical protein VPHK392_0008 [Vibrio phage K392]